jgi:hypothetical protein
MKGREKAGSHIKYEFSYLTFSLWVMIYYSSLISWSILSRTRHIIHHSMLSSLIAMALTFREIGLESLS